MGRYFFHITENGRVHRDEVGEPCANAEEAVAYARRLAVEFVAEFQNSRRYIIDVVDSSGKQISRLVV